MQRLGVFSEIIREQFEFKGLLIQITRRDLLLRYKQTAMGFAWAVMMPVVNTIIFSMVFTRVAPVETPVPYPLFAYCGLLVWNFTGSALRFAVASLTANANLVTKVYFPREVFPFSAVAVSLVDFAVGTTLLVGMMVYYRVAPSPTWLLLPAVILVQVAFTAALGLILAMANLYYRDVKYVVELMLTVWMFASAVVYPSDNLTGWFGLLVRANPMTAIVESMRNILLYGRPPVEAFAWTALVTAFLLPFAWLTFHESEFRFAERI